MSQGQKEKVAVEQVGGDHYQKPIQAWDYIVANNIGFLEGNVIKYVSRWQDKDGLSDLLKAKSYIEKLIAIEQQKQIDLTPLPTQTREERLAQLNAEAAALMQEDEEPQLPTDEHGWTIWTGGKCPVTLDSMVAVILRNGTCMEPAKAFFRNWAHHDRYDDIVRYRVVRL